MNSCDVYLADSKTGAKLGKMAKHETVAQMFTHHGFEYASAPKFPISYNAPPNGIGPRLCKHGLYVFITEKSPLLFVHGYERATNSGAHTKPAQIWTE